MKIFLHELSDQETLLDFTQDDAWVAEAVTRVDEKTDLPAGDRAVTRLKPRPIQAHFSLRKVDDVVVVNGSIETYVELLCSRCANGFRLDCQPSFSALFCKDPAMAGVGYLDPSGPRATGELKPAGQNRGFARHAHDKSLDNAEATGADLDITYLSTDTIELGDVVTEQLRLQIPFQPLCDEACKGVCANCGADLNVGRCACAKITRESPFAALKNIKLSQQAQK